MPCSEAAFEAMDSHHGRSDYEACVIERIGDPVKEDIARSQKAMTKVGKAERRALMEQLRGIKVVLVESMNRGLDPAADAIDPLIARHRI